MGVDTVIRIHDVASAGGPAPGTTISAKDLASESTKRDWAAADNAPLAGDTVSDARQPLPPTATPAGGGMRTGAPMWAVHTVAQPQNALTPKAAGPCVPGTRSCMLKLVDMFYGSCCWHRLPSEPCQRSSPESYQ